LQDPEDFLPIRNPIFYPREKIAAIYATSSLEVLKEHIKFLYEFIETGEKQALAEWNSEREGGLALASYAAMCLQIARQELTRRGVAQPSN
jgi:hypothetical protein